jgi:hypothetical protein
LKKSYIFKKSYGKKISRGFLVPIKIGFLVFSNLENVENDVVVVAAKRSFALDNTKQSLTLCIYKKI